MVRRWRQHSTSLRSSPPSHEIRITHGPGAIAATPRVCDHPTRSPCGPGPFRRAWQSCRRAFVARRSQPGRGTVTLGAKRLYMGSMADFDDVVVGRHSSRAFDPQRTVPLELLREIFQLAQKTPSNCNAQAWRVFVAGGERCERLRRRLVERVKGGEPPEERTTPAFTGDYRRLQVACAVELYQKIGVARDDKAGRARAALRNYEFFDAPHVAIVCMDRSFDFGVALGVGGYVQTLMLAMHSRGVASCAQASLRGYASHIVEELGIPPDLMVMCGISFGYELPDAPANQVRQDRSPLDDNVAFIDYPE